MPGIFGKQAGGKASSGILLCVCLIILENIESWGFFWGGLKVTQMAFGLAGGAAGVPSQVPTPHRNGFELLHLASWVEPVV